MDDDADIALAEVEDELAVTPSGSQHFSRLPLTI